MFSPNLAIFSCVLEGCLQSSASPNTSDTRPLFFSYVFLLFNFIVDGQWVNQSQWKAPMSFRHTAKLQQPCWHQIISNMVQHGPTVSNPLSFSTFWTVLSSSFSHFWPKRAVSSNFFFKRPVQSALVIGRMKSRKGRQDPQKSGSPFSRYLPLFTMYVLRASSHYMIFTVMPYFFRISSHFSASNAAIRKKSKYVKSGFWCGQYWKHVYIKNHSASAPAFNNLLLDVVRLSIQIFLRHLQCLFLASLSFQGWLHDTRTSRVSGQWSPNELNSYTYGTRSYT